MSDAELIIIPKVRPLDRILDVLCPVSDPMVVIDLRGISSLDYKDFIAVYIDFMGKPAGTCPLNCIPEYRISLSQSNLLK